MSASVSDNKSVWAGVGGAIKVIIIMESIKVLYL